MELYLLSYIKSVLNKTKIVAKLIIKIDCGWFCPINVFVFQL